MQVMTAVAAKANMPKYESFWVQSHASGYNTGNDEEPVSDCAVSTFADQKPKMAICEHLSASAATGGSVATISLPGWPPRYINMNDLRLHDVEYYGLRDAKACTISFFGPGLPAVNEPVYSTHGLGLLDKFSLSADIRSKLHVSGFLRSSEGIVQPALLDVNLIESDESETDNYLNASLTVHDPKLSYINKVRDQLIAVRPDPQSTPPTAGYRDVLGFVVDYRDGKPTSLGEATYYTALAAVAFATFQFNPDEWAKAKANTSILELLSTLIEEGWGNKDHLGQKHPVRYPKDFDYDYRGQIIRARPLTKDSYGQIIAATHYAYICPNTSQEVKGKALHLLQMWIEYLSVNQWRTHSNYLVDEFVTERVNGVDVSKNIFGKGGARAEPIGIESYLLQPHDIYALKNSAAKLFPTINWNVWENLSSEISQAIVDVAAPYLGSLAGRTIDYILQQLVFSVKYDIPLGAAGWNFGNAKGIFSISITADVRAKAAKIFAETVTDTIKEGFRAGNPTNQQRLAEIVVNRILALLPLIFAADTWKQILGDLVTQVMPWITGDVYMEVATFIATLSLLETKPKPFIVSYTSWVYIVECESRRDIMTILGPFLSDFFLSLKNSDNPNGFWAWLSGDQDEVNRQLSIFESNHENQWWQFAYGPTKFNKWFKDSRNQYPDDLRNSSSRLDYLLLEGLTRKGRPQGLPRVELDPKNFTIFAEHALDVFRLGVQKAFKEAGRYVQQWVDREGRTVFEMWKKPDSYTRSIFESGREIGRLSNTAGQAVQQWLWNADGSLHEYAIWFTDRVITDAGLAERTLRRVDGQLERWRWAVGGAFKSYDKWWTSSTDGAAKASDLIEARIRSAQGELEVSHWGVNGVFQTYKKWRMSSIKGAAKASDAIESKVRSITGQLERTIWAAGGVFRSYDKWWTSSINGAAEAGDIIKSNIRDTTSQLEITTWAIGRIFQSYNKWRTSNIDGAVKAGDVIESKVRGITGQLETTTWAIGGIFQSYRKWRASSTSGAAKASDAVESKVRNITGQLERTTWSVGGAFQSYGRWLNSTTKGGADSINMVENRVRSAQGQLEIWVWNNKHVFQKYWLWSRSSADGSATKEHIIEVFTQLADGSRVVETWDSSRRYAKTVFDSVGRVISGIRIPFPRWPPKW